MGMISDPSHGHDMSWPSPADDLANAIRIARKKKRPSPSDLENMLSGLCALCEKNRVSYIASVPDLLDWWNNYEAEHKSY